MRSGKILRFDDLRGYGFIVPDGGGSDVFVHANELCDDKEVFSPGTPVEFEVLDGDRGPKAFAVRVAGNRETDGDQKSATPETRAPAGTLSYDDDLCDVLASEELSRELTELFLGTVPELTGAQIVRLRGSLLVVARKHGWLED